MNKKKRVPVWEKPTPDKLNIKFWQEHKQHPARILVDRLLSTRSEWVVSFMDKYWWYNIVQAFLTETAHATMNIAPSHNRQVKPLVSPHATPEQEIELRKKYQKMVIQIRDLVDERLGHHNHRTLIEELVPTVELLLKADKARSVSC